MKLVALSILVTCISVYSQQADMYLVAGRVLDDNGRPLPNAGVCIEPTVFTAQGFDRFIECVGTSNDGTFHIQKSRNALTEGTQYSLFVYSDTTPDALLPVRPPYDGLRKLEPSFEGIPLKLSTQTLVNLGDVRVKFRYGTTTLKLTWEKAKRFNWLTTFVKVRTENGNVAVATTLSLKDVRSYVRKSELRVSLPVGNWKIELIDMDSDKKIAESELFSIKVEHNKPVLIRPTDGSRAIDK